jgi:hypothetical protein
MKYYLKNMSYLYIMTSINKSEMFNTKENLEQLNYGTAELNALFNSLPEDTQNKIKKYQNKEVQINILKNIADPELTAFYKTLSENDKKKLDSIGIRDKYFFLKNALNKKKLQDSE